MKLAVRLSILVVIVVAVVFGTEGLLRLRRDVAAAEVEAQRDHMQYGRAVAAVLAETWEDEGEVRARRQLDQLSSRESNPGLRWVEWGQGASQERRIEPSVAARSELEAGRAVSTWSETEDGWPLLVTTVPIANNAGLPRAVELSESLERPASRVRAMGIRFAGTLLLLVLVSGSAITWIGHRLVGRPVERVLARARGVEGAELIPNDLQPLAEAIDVLGSRANEALQLAQRESARREEAETKLRHADRLAKVGLLSASLAHELGAPLNVVRLQAQLIGGGELRGEDLADEAAIVVEQCDRMTSIVRTLLDFSRAAPGPLEPVEVLAEARQVARLVAPLAHRSGVTVELDGRPVRVRARRGELQQVLLNLVVNGIQAMGEGGRLDLVVACDAGRVEVVVTDRGCGIAPQDRARLFEPFFTTKPPGLGTGLGLGVCRAIVQDLGGTLELQSEPGEGTRAVVVLPEAAG